MKSPINWTEYIRENENRALSEIYDEHREPFLSWVQNNGNFSRDQALEIFQVSIIILYENVISGKLKMLDNVKSYLFTIGKNKMMEHFRKIKKSHHESFNESSLFNAATLDELDFDEERDVLLSIENALQKLGDPCKILLESYYFKKLSLQEIALKMKYKNTDTAKTKKFKCIQRLRKMFLVDKS